MAGPDFDKWATDFGSKHGLKPESVVTMRARIQAMKEIRSRHQSAGDNFMAELYRAAFG